MTIKILKHKHKCFSMSEEEFVFYTPSQLIEARRHAIVTNKEKIRLDYENIKSRLTKKFQYEINEKLMAASTSTWEQTDATEFILRFDIDNMFDCQLSEPELNIIDKYMVHFNHEKHEKNGFNHIVYLTEHVLTPLFSKLISLGYNVDVDETNKVGFLVSWKLI